MSEQRTTVTVTKVDVTFDAEGRETRVEDRTVMTWEEFQASCLAMAQAIRSAPPRLPRQWTKEFVDAWKPSTGDWKA